LVPVARQQKANKKQTQKMTAYFCCSFFKYNEAHNSPLLKKLTHKYNQTFVELDPFSQKSKINWQRITLILLIFPGCNFFDLSFPDACIKKVKYFDCG
jgi:hypothetical protein